MKGILDVSSLVLLRLSKVPWAKNLIHQEGSRRKEGRKEGLWTPLP